MVALTDIEYASTQNNQSNSISLIYNRTDVDKNVCKYIWIDMYTYMCIVCIYV